MKTVILITGLLVLAMAQGCAVAVQMGGSSNRNAIGARVQQQDKHGRTMIVESDSDYGYDRKGNRYVMIWGRWHKANPVMETIERVHSDD